LVELWERIGGEPWTLLEDAFTFANGIVDTYDGIDIKYISRRIARWWTNNPKKADGRRHDVPAFLDNWFAREYDKLQVVNISTPNTSTPSASGRTGVIWDD
jgi:hypothetical protein